MALIRIIYHKLNHKSNLDKDSFNSIILETTKPSHHYITMLKTGLMIYCKWRARRCTSLPSIAISLWESALQITLKVLVNKKEKILIRISHVSSLSICRQHKHIQMQWIGNSVWVSEKAKNSTRWTFDDWSLSVITIYSLTAIITALSCWQFWDQRSCHFKRSCIWSTNTPCMYEVCTSTIQIPHFSLCWLKRQSYLVTVDEKCALWHTGHSRVVC